MMFKRNISIIAVIVVVMVSVGFSYCNANIKQIDENNKNMLQENIDYESIEGEINILKKLKIGGVDQWINITGKDKKNPILLILHGGPGFAMMPIFEANNKELENDFTIVNWDQRGAGKSYYKNIPEESMTLQQLVQDANEITEYLKSKFKQNKIYIMAHSFGSIIGIELIEKYPQNYLAYIGTGQVVDFARNERFSYDFVYNMALEDNNKEALDILTTIGQPDENGSYINDSGYEETSKLVEYYGGDLNGKKSLDEIYDLIFENNIYQNDVQKILDGYEFSQLLFEDEDVLKLDFMSNRLELKVPVYFMLGRNDYDTPSILAEKYFDAINAPSKELIWFKNSAHFPFYEEPEKFNQIIKEKFSK